jgi:hypothetical protein
MKSALVLTVLLLAGCGSAGRSTPSLPAVVTFTEPVPGETATVTATATVVHTAPAVTVTAPPPPPATAFAGDGIFLVGKDVQPGTYKSDGGSGCYWGRQDSAGNTIANNIGDGPSVVTIQPGDFAIKTQSCAPFHKA